MRIKRKVAFTAATLVLLFCLSASLPGCGAPGPRSSGATDFAAIKREAGKYLNASGRQMARGKTDGASVYSITASVDTKLKTVSGREEVQYTNRSGTALSEVVFRVYASGIGTGQDEKPVNIMQATANGKQARESLDGSILKVTVPGGIAPAASAVVSFSFAESVPPAGHEKSGGLYAYAAGTYDLGNFLPTVVRNASGSWDTRPIPWDGDINYFDCSYYSVSLAAPAGYSVAATGVESSPCWRGVG